MLQAALGEAEGGIWTPGSVTLTVRDALNPSNDNIVLAFHELAGHPVFSTLTDAEKQMMLRAFSKVAVPEGAGVIVPPGADPAQVTAEEALVERASRTLAAEGFTPSRARGLAQAFVRFLKAMYYRVALAIQSAVLGEQHISVDLAQAYFENRMRQFLAGDPSPMSFVSFLGGPRLTLDRERELFDSELIPAEFNYDTGEMEYREVLPETMAALRFNQRVSNLSGGSNGQRPFTAKRLPQGAQRALTEGSFAAAAEVARGVHQAAENAGETAPRTRDERAAIAKRLKAEEELRLEAWAKENGRWLDEGEFTAKWQRDGSIEGGEHQVFEEGGRWYKRNAAALHGTWLEYFHRLTLHNTLFPESAYRFEGFMRYNGELWAVTSQPDIQAVRGATRAEVRAAMEKLGFYPFSSHHPNDYYNADSGIVVQDLHDENAVVTRSGEIAAIDPIPYVPDKLDFQKGGMLFGQPMSNEIRYSMRGDASTAYVRTSDPHLISRDLNSPAKVEEDVAAYNALDEMHRTAYRAFESIRPGLFTFEEFVSVFTGSDTLASEKIKARNEELVANGHRPVDVTLKPQDLLAESSQMQAADKAYRYGWNLREFWSRKRKEAERFLKTAKDRLDRSNSRLAELMRRYTEMDLQFANASIFSGSRLFIFHLAGAEKRVGAAHGKNVDDRMGVQKLPNRGSQQQTDQR